MSELRKPKYFSNEDFIQGPKKFVFQLQPENVKYIEELSYQEKQDFINQLITNHRLESAENYHKEVFRKNIWKAAIAVIIIVIVVPILFSIINFSIHSTQRSYKEMQQNFSKLYH